MFVFQVYKKKTETAKKEYLKQLAAYRASLVSQVRTHTHTHVMVIQLLVFNSSVRPANWS